MIRLAIRELVSRRTASALAALGMITATLGFIVLSSTSQTTQAVLTGDISKAWQTPYDILVRPVGRDAPLERRAGLVRPNFLSGLTGGITGSQLQAIRSLYGVQVAAPLAVAGFFYLSSYESVDLTAEAPAGQLTGFRVTESRIGDAGMSAYPPQVEYLLGSPDAILRDVITGSARTTTLELPGRTIACGDPLAATSSIVCAAPRIVCVGLPCSGTNPNWIGTAVSFGQPVVVAGIDPAAESQLAGLDHCVTKGRYLQASDRAEVIGATGSTGGSRNIPVLVSEHGFVDESINLRVDRLVDPPVADQGSRLAAAHGWSPVVSRAYTADQIYRDTLARQQYGSVGTFFSFSSSWTPGDVVYTGAGDHLTATTVPADPSAFESRFGGFSLAQLLAPETSDSWFRPLAVHRNLTPAAASGGPAEALVFNAAGRYNPECLAGFDPLAGGRLEAYSAPDVRLAGGHQLGATASPAGYVTTPPTALTTLDAIRALDNPAVFAGAPGDAYISAIRVRVIGVETPGALAQARLARVAAEIKDATGLQVDIIKGSSPRLIQVDLPAGRFGRPALTVSEPWSAKGVGFRFLQAVAAQDLAIFALVLLGAALLVGQTAFINARRRRSEFGMLRALGWPGIRIAALVEIEMLVLGAVTGLLSVAVGLPLAAALGLGVDRWRLALVGPLLSIAVAGVAGLIPALAAGRHPVIATMVRPGAVRTSRAPATAFGLGIRELRTEWRAEAALGTAAVALGASLVGTIVVISAAFHGQLDTTVLGTYLAGAVRSFHIALAALTLGLGAIAVAEIVSLGYMERQGQLAALRALGWPAGAVVRVVLAQGVAFGCLGGAASAVVVGGVGLVLSTPGWAIAQGLVAAAVAALLATLVATTAPLVHAYRSSPAEGLRGE